MRVLIFGCVLLGVAGCGRDARPPASAELASSEAIAALQGDTSSYRLIYYPAVDLARRQPRR